MSETAGSTEEREAVARAIAASYYHMDDCELSWQMTAECGEIEAMFRKADAALSALAPIRAQEIAAARAEEQGYRHTQVAALNQVHAAEILAAEVNERAVLDWLTAHHNVELSHYAPVYADEDDDAVEWRATRVNGGVNDREWTIIGRGQTARAALMDAMHRNEHGAGK